MYLSTDSKYTPNIVKYILSNKEKFNVKSVGYTEDETITFLDILIEGEKLRELSKISKEEYLLINIAPKCPTCGRYVVSGLKEDYRGKLYLSKLVHCMDCFYLDDKTLNIMNELKDSKEKFEKMMTLLNE